MIKTVIKWSNGVVMVFDEQGNQLQQYQGKHKDVREKILKDAPASAVFKRGTWGVGTDTIDRKLF